MTSNPKPNEPPSPAGETASNLGNPSRAPQVASNDKATQPDVLPPKEAAPKDDTPEETTKKP